MELRQNASKDFLTLAPSDKDSFGKHVIDCITEANALKLPAFPNLPLPVADLQQTNNAMHDAIAAAMSGDHYKIDLRNAAVKLWDVQFGATSDYVSQVANGDPAIITLAGYTPTKGQRTAKGKPRDARFKRVTPGTGSAEIKVEPQTEADAFLYILAPAEGADIRFGADGMATITVGDKKVYIKCDTHRDVVLGGLAEVKMQVAVQPINTAGVGSAATGQNVTPQ